MGVCLPFFIDCLKHSVCIQFTNIRFNHKNACLLSMAQFKNLQWSVILIDILYVQFISEFVNILLILAGTIWLQQILSLIEVKGDVTATNDQLNSQRVPWIELLDSEKQFVSAPSPRIHVSHLPYKFMPLGLKQKKGKVRWLLSRCHCIYMASVK